MLRRIIMNLVKCRFFIMINLGLPIESFKMKYNSKQILVTAEKNKIASYVPFKCTNIDWENIKDKDTYKSELTIHNQKDEKMILQEIYINKDDNFKYGFKQYSVSNIIEVDFEEDSCKPFNVIENQTQYIRTAKEYLIHFIDIYRYSTQLGFITNPRSIVSPLVQMLICKDSIFEDLGSKELNFTNLTSQITTEIVNGDVFNSYELPTYMLDKFAQKLSIGYELKLYEKFIVNSREQCFVYKDYPLSIVLIETAFETFIKGKLIGLCTMHNIKTLPTSYKPYNYISYKDAIDSGNIVADLLKRYIKLIIKRSIDLNSTQYKSWKKDAYKKRNEIVHNGFYKYGQSDAELAFESTIALMDYINKFCS